MASHMKPTPHEDHFEAEALPLFGSVFTPTSSRPRSWLLGLRPVANITSAAQAHGRARDVGPFSAMQHHPAASHLAGRSESFSDAPRPLKHFLGWMDHWVCAEFRSVEGITLS